MSGTAESKVIRAATNEWVLLLIRSFIAMVGAAGLWVITDVRNGQDKSNAEIAKLAAQFNDFRLTNEARISKVEGMVGLLKGSIDVHHGRLQDLDAKTGALWNRLYDLSKAPQRGNP